MSVYAVADLHGMRELYNKIWDYVTDEDTLIVVGDVCDRGPYGYTIMKDLLSRDNVVYLKGNHELMFVEAANSYKTFYSLYSHDVSYHESQGGRQTLMDWIDEGCPDEIIQKIKGLRDIYAYRNAQDKTIILTHSGGMYDRLWDRSHFKSEQYIPEDVIIVHGHSPVQLLKDYDICDEITYPAVYSNGQKIDIDCCSYVSNTAVLLNLDTLEPIVITHN